MVFLLLVVLENDGLCIFCIVRLVGSMAICMLASCLLPAAVVACHASWGLIMCTWRSSHGHMTGTMQLRLPELVMLYKSCMHQMMELQQASQHRLQCIWLLRCHSSLSCIWLGGIGACCMQAVSMLLQSVSHCLGCQVQVFHEALCTDR